MFNTQETLVTIIPENVEGLVITLSAEVDLDLQLYLGEDNNGGGLCIAGYDCQYDWLPEDEEASQPFTYEGMTMTFSGDDRVQPVSETITIDKTDRTLALYVKAYGTGVGTVAYSWDAISPCPDSFEGCEPCTSLAGTCKDGVVVYR
eukprot:UN06860